MTSQICFGCNVVMMRSFKAMAQSIEQAEAKVAIFQGRTLEILQIGKCRVYHRSMLQGRKSFNGLKLSLKSAHVRCEADRTSEPLHKWGSLSASIGRAGHSHDWQRHTVHSMTQCRYADDMQMTCNSCSDHHQASNWYP